MAFVTDTHSVPRAGTGFWTAVAKGFEVYADRRSRRSQIEYLQALTDAELAEKGIDRDRIVHYVFRDMMAI